MRIASLRLRLILLSVVSISVALAATTIILNTLFHAFFEERIFAELDRDLIQLTANLSIDENNDISVAPLSNPQYDLPFSGLYWQISEKGEVVASSRSLWGITFDFPESVLPGDRVRNESNSSQGVPLIILGWSILLGEGDNQRVISISVAANESEVIVATAEFRSSFLQWLLVLFLGLIIAAWIQVRLGLSPLETLRKKVEGIRSGQDQRLAGDFPLEVQPLANEVNELLELHDTSLNRAREKASDLAHGLKTPLTVMMAVAQDLRKDKLDEHANEIETQVESMRHFVERELARVRSKTDGSKQTDVAPVIEKIVSAIRRFPREAPLSWEIDIEDGLTSPFDAHDLSEILGNVLDNARKWADSVVQLTAKTLPDGYASIVVEDDGNGVPDEKLDAIINRGERLDPSAQGSGLGLAICADLAESYGVTFEVAKPTLGGLRVTIMWQS